MAALGAEGGSGLNQRFTAFGAEFGAAHVGSALAAEVFWGLGVGRGGLGGNVRTGGHINASHIVGLTSLLFQLLAGGVHFCLGLVGGQLFGEVRGALLAKVRFGVPADLVADPAAASGALPKVGAHFFDSFGERSVVQPAPYRPFHFVRGVACAAPTAEETVGDVQDRFGHTDGGGLELSHVAVAAFVAMELELVAAVGGKIVVVVDELNERHMGILPD